MLQNQKKEKSSLLDLDNENSNTTQIGDLLNSEENNFLNKYKIDESKNANVSTGGDNMLEIAKKMQEARK